MTLRSSFKLVGSCNRCGRCCTDGDLHCINLEIIENIGKPYATRCRIYDQRTVGMPILLVNSFGVIEAIASCTFGDSRIETKEIMEKGIGHGCSYEVVEA